VEHAVVLDNVTKRFGSFTAVDGLSLIVPRGQVLGFLGPNGAGKTTTIRMIMSIIYPDEGGITILGHGRASEVKDRVGYLPEERGLYRKMTVAQTLRYFGRLKGLRGRELEQRLSESLARVKLAEWSNHRTEALSKGMQQKLQFVGTLLHRPELVILDEPFSGLDPLNVDLLKSLINEQRQAGVTVIFSTHQMEQAERLCDRILLINRGRQVIEGTIADVRATFAARILELEGTGDWQAVARAPGVAGAHLTAGLARLELTDDADPELLIRHALAHARLTRFEIVRPDLEEIFVRLVRGDGEADTAVAAGEASRG